MGKSDQAGLVLEAVLERIVPISGNSPTGDDASSSEPYFRLEMEIGKVNPDYDLCADLASDILKERSKDLRVAAWLCFVWFRNRKVPGFTQGFILIRELLKTFGNRLFPVSPVHRGKSLQFLNSGRVVKLLEAESIAVDTAQAFLDLAGAFRAMAAEIRHQLGEHAPELSGLAQVISSRASAAQEILSSPPPSPGIPAAAPPVKPAAAPAKGASARGPEKPPEPTPESATAMPKDSPDAAIGLKNLQADSEKDAVVAIKKALRYFIEIEKDEAKKYSGYVFGVSRALVWGRLVAPAGSNGVTPVPPPDPAIQSKIKEWFSQKEWDKLISAAELNVLDEDGGFKYWITAQKLLCTALEEKGGIASKASENVRFHIAGLLRKFPEFLRLKFSNGTPFADEDTLRWIEETVKPLQAGEGEGTAVLPPILGEDYEAANRDYQAFCSELPNNFEANLKTLELGIAGDHRRKGRFLRTLNLANFCQAAKHYELAKIHIRGLLDTIESLRLDEWEPALCAAVWQAAYLINKKLAPGEKSKEKLEALAKQQEELFNRIGTYDGVLALKLAHLK